MVNKKKKIKTSFYYNLSKKDHKHDRVIFYLNKNITLIYNDVRKFGFIKILESDYKASLHLKNLGPEPLEKNYNFEYFKKILKKEI